MAATGFFIESVLKHIFGIGSYSATASVYAGLENMYGELSPASDMGYARQAVSFRGAEHSGDGITSINNSVPITFQNSAGQNWQAAQWLVIYDAASAGNALFRCDLDEFLHVAAGTSRTFQPGQVRLWLDGERWSDYLRQKVLEGVFIDGSLIQPTIYIALTHSSPGPAGTGSGLSEPDESDGYARKEFSGFYWTVMEMIRNDDDINFDPATSGWAAFNHVATVDGDDNLLAWTDLSPPDDVSIAFDHYPRIFAEYYECRLT